MPILSIIRMNAYATVLKRHNANVKYYLAALDSRNDVAILKHLTIIRRCNKTMKYLTNK